MKEGQMEIESLKQERAKRKPYILNWPKKHEIFPHIF